MGMAITIGGLLLLAVLIFAWWPPRCSRCRRRMKLGEYTWICWCDSRNGK